MEKTQLKELINSGLSTRQLAIKLNSSQSNIKYWLKKHNLKTIFNQYNKSNNKNPIEKFCPKCKTTKPIDEYYKRYNRKDVSGYCKKCSNKYHQKRVQQVKIKMILYKGGCCVDCNLKLENSHYSVFDFHHLDPNTKDPNFAKIKFQKWEKIKKEIDKCDLLCSNCHRLRHAEDIVLD